MAPEPARLRGRSEATAETPGLRGHGARASGASANSTAPPEPALANACAAPGAFAELLRRHRLVAGLSQRDLADRSGLSERAIRDLERGATARPRRHSVGAVAEVLGLRGAELAAFQATAFQPATRHDVAPGGDADARAEPIGRTDPAQPGDLTGREHDLRALVDLVSGGRHRLITLVGPAGVGKSRLAAELAAVLERPGALDRPGGLAVPHVDLSALRDPGLIGELVADALGFGGPSRLAPAERIAAQLRGRRAVVVLDCFERLVSGAAEVTALVRRCPGLTVIVTTRRPLHVAGVRLLRVEPLPVPLAMDLFARRAAAVRPDFRLTAANRDAVAAICEQVDGLPLAVELAAARMRLLTPGELAARLGRPLSVLTGGARDLPLRHRSLRTAIESSLEAVDAPARTLFAWLAAFAGGGLLADIEAVAVAFGRDSEWVHGALTELVDISLVRVTGEGGESRYTLPAAMAELAADRRTLTVREP
jgi:predicted ATPase/transcriptional regulator with XRE-family HTH domain